MGLVIKQVKSANGTNAPQRDTLRSLGLKRIGHVVVKQDRPEIRGMLATVPHLVAVETVPDETPHDEALPNEDGD